MTAILEALSGTITGAVNWLLGTGDDEVGIPQTAVFSEAEFHAAGAGHQSYYNYMDGTKLRPMELFGHLFLSHGGVGPSTSSASDSSATPIHSSIWSPFSRPPVRAGPLTPA